MPAQYKVDETGVYVEDETGSHRVCDQALEVVSFSSLDDTYYVRWPGDGMRQHMGALPGDLLDEDHPEHLGERLRHIGVDIEEGRDREVTRFLRQSADRLPRQR